MKAGGERQSGGQTLFGQPLAFDKNQFRFAAIAHAARVFEPFAQGERGSNRRYGGTGLGLAISKRLATMLDGSLTVRSEVGRGSRFTLRVPAEMARVSMREPRPTVRRPPIGLRVLVVEDNYVNQAVARAMLEDLGAVVGLASDGAAAVEVGLAQPWDIVLMDCQMPGMDGYEATRALRRAGFRSPILAMTAGAFESDRDAAFASGMDEWLVKPVVRDALAAALDHWCRRSAEGVVSDAVVEDVADGPMSA